MPLLRNTDSSKISKRKNPAARLTWFREQGYLPEALVNFLALLAYPPVLEDDGTEREVFTFEEFSERFDWGKVNPVGPVFDLKKLDWVNGVHIRELELGELTSRLLPYLAADGVLGERPTLGELARLRRVTELIQTRIAHLTEAADLVRPFYLADDALDIAEDARAQLDENAPRVLDAAVAALESVDAEVSGALGSETGWQAARIEAGIAGGPRRRAGAEAEVRLRSVADRRVGTSGQPTALRVDGDPRSDIHPRAPSGAAGDALRRCCDGRHPDPARWAEVLGPRRGHVYSRGPAPRQPPGRCGLRVPAGWGARHR